MKKMLFLLFPFLVLCFISNVHSVAQETHAAPMESLFPMSEGLHTDHSHPVLSKRAGQWSAAPVLLSAKCYAAATISAGELYVFGGLGGDLRFDTKCYKLNLESGLWSAIAALPVQRALSAAQVVNGKIYIIGGYSSTNPFTVQPAVLEYNPATNTYTSKATMPVAVFGAGSFVYNDRIWILGGGTTAFSTSISTIQIYDPTTDRWTISAGTLPAGTWGQGVAAVGNTVLHVGGVRYTGTQGLFGAWSFKGTISGDDISWTPIADYPDGSIMRLSAGADENKMYFSGGHNAGSQNNGPPSGRTYSFDPTNNTWKMMDQKPTPVYFASQMAYDGNEKLYIVGGNDAPSRVTAAVEVLTTTAEGGPLAHFARTTLETWLKLGSSIQEHIDIANNGSIDLTWNADVDPSSTSWLSLANASGTVAPGEKAPITFVINSAAGTGTHTGNVSVSTNDPANSNTTLFVTVRIQEQDVDAELNVLAEIGTGTWCGFCPYGADSLKAVVNRYPGRVNAITYHGGSATEPMQTPSTSYWTNVIKLTGWPQGSIHRVVFDGMTSMALSRGAWNPRMEELLQTRRSPISLNVVSSTYHLASKQTELTIEVLFHRDVTHPIRLNIAQVQDQMNYQQTFYPPGGGSTKLYPYFHDHVLRNMIPSDAGEIISTGSTVVSQTRISKTFNFTSVDSTIETSRFIIFAHISDGVSHGEVLQSMQIPLSSFLLDTRALPNPTSFALHANFPNPFNPSTTVDFELPKRSHVAISVSDVLGREVARLADGMHDAGRHHIHFDAHALSPGSYFLNMRSDNFSQTRVITLLR